MSISEYQAKQRARATRLEKERLRLKNSAQKSESSKALYGALLWELALAYESLQRWNEARSCYAELFELKLPYSVLASGLKKKFNIAPMMLFNSEETPLQVDYRRLLEKIRYAQPNLPVRKQSN
jgi:hypothetical protein